VIGVRRFKHLRIPPRFYFAFWAGAKGHRKKWSKIELKELPKVNEKQKKLLLS
jgi:hypothetical protein